MYNRIILTGTTQTRQYLTQTHLTMDLKEIQELIKLLNKSNISEIRIERDNFKITLRTHDLNPPVQYVRQETTAMPQSQSMSSAPSIQPASRPGDTAA
jgi:acetyl-CoA carboxylase biotin carboxyl carrier protein